MRPTEESLSRARRLHAATIGVDGHIDTVQRVLIDGEDISRRTASGHVDLPRLREGGMRAPFFALYVPAYYRGAEAVRRMLQLRDAMQSLFDAHPDEIALATTAAEVERIAGEGRIAAVLTLESGHAIADDPAVLRMAHRLGVRSMTLTHLRNHHWADSSTDAPEHGGLTEFGREVVSEMNRIGMIVDVSHASDRTFADALAVSRAPVIASHSSCRTLCDVPRNLSDDMIRALARTGGVVGINFCAGFLHRDDRDPTRRGHAADPEAPWPALTGRDLDEFAAREHRRPPRAETGRATIADAANHIDHVVHLVGVDHVGIGSDWDGVPGVPAGLEDVSRMPVLTALLLERGYDEDDLRKILGGNFLRVLREVTGA